MKKILLFIIALSAFSLNCKAQFFIGGNLSFSSTSIKTNIENKTQDYSTQTSFSFGPTVGYYFSDKWLAGLGLILSPTSKKGEMERTTKEFNWLIEPYARYRMIGYSKFGVWIDGGLRFGGNTSSTKNDNVTTKNAPISVFGIRAYPVLTFDLTERIALEASLRFLELSYSQTTKKDTVIGSDEKYKIHTHNVNFGAAADDIFGEIGKVKIGMVYKF